MAGRPFRVYATNCPARWACEACVKSELRIVFASWVGIVGAYAKVPQTIYGKEDEDGWTYVQSR